MKEGSKLLIGGHVSAAGGLVNAIENAELIGANAIQLFGSSPRQWRVTDHAPESFAAFKRAYASSGIGPVFLHAPYLVNLASPLESAREHSEVALAAHFRIAANLGARGLIFHIGSGKELEKNKAFEVVVHHMKNILKRVPGETLLIIENSAGGGGKIGSRLEEIGEIIDAVGSRRIGVCLDTAHAFESGLIEEYSPANIKALSHAVRDTFGFDRLSAIHVNDSKTPFNSHHDRHENIGEGYIGIEGFKNLAHTVEFREKPWILEVPGFDNLGPDKKNIEILKSCFA